MQSGTQEYEHKPEGWLGQMIEDADRASYTIVHICIIIIVACLLSALIVTLTLFIARALRQRLEAKTAALEDQYEQFLAGILFEDDDEGESTIAEKAKKFRKKHLTNTFKKRVFRKQLLRLHKNMAGSAREMLNKLYRDMNLHKEGLIQLRSTDWSEKADAVRELSQMQISEAKDRVIRLTSHENEVLRLEAQVAMLVLDKENPFGFLRKKRALISEWQQLNLEEAIKKIDIRKIPVFSQWFTLKNPTAVQFCIKMTSAYNQFDAAPELIRLLHSPHKRIVKEAVITLGNMMIHEALQPLIDLYSDSDYGIRNEIIISLGKIADDSALVFLADLMYEGPHEISMKAATALKMAGADGEKILLKAAESDVPLAVSVSMHLLDERI
jgi:HEAT repeat protein